MAVPGRPEVDDGFDGLGPVAGRVMRWIPTWVMIFIVGMWLLPTAGGVIASLRPVTFVRAVGWWEGITDPSTWTLEAYRIALDASANNSFVESLVNSFAIAIPSTLIPLAIASWAAYAIVWIPFRGSRILFLAIVALIPLAIASWAAYAIVWIPFRGSRILFLAIVALIAVPIYGVLIPLLQAYVSGVHLTLPMIDKTVTLLPEMGLAGSLTGVWVTHVGTQLPFCIFLLVFAVARVPQSLIDSARVEGADDVHIYWRIVVPLIIPALTALGVLLFVWAWNDFVVALTIIGFNAADFPATVRFGSIGTVVSGPVALASVFIHSSVAVAVFLVLQRSFERGMLMSAE